LEEILMQIYFFTLCFLPNVILAGFSISLYTQRGLLTEKDPKYLGNVRGLSNSVPRTEDRD